MTTVRTPLPYRRWIIFAYETCNHYHSLTCTPKLTGNTANKMLMALPHIRQVQGGLVQQVVFLFLSLFFFLGNISLSASLSAHAIKVSSYPSTLGRLDGGDPKKKNDATPQGRFLIFTCFPSSEPLQIIEQQILHIFKYLPADTRDRSKGQGKYRQ